MPGSGLMVFMAVPLLLSGAIVVFARRHLQDASLLRGLWLIPIAVAGTVASGALHRTTDLDDALVNRSLSALVLAGCVIFVVVNRHRVTGLVRAGVLMTTIGAGLNALATLVYGFMPVLQSAARYLGDELATGSHPTSRYVTAHGSQTFAVLIGDAIPIRGLNAIISIGDVLLIPGCSILLAACVAPLFFEDDDTDAGAPGPSHRTP
ncbi:MAG: hypothetical protein JWN22_2886 [Nocardioides sp.]|jgi:hypothetical protein|nr:hypothetical protein [Nocardioides sp.]